MRPQGKGAGNCILLSTYIAYFLWFGSDNESCIVGLTPSLTDERSKIQLKVGEAVIIPTEGAALGGGGRGRQGKHRMARGAFQKALSPIVSLGQEKALGSHHQVTEKLCF